jgi:hypothetical protein
MTTPSPPPPPPSEKPLSKSTNAKHASAAASNDGATLGCSGLILIAIVVAMCSGRSEIDAMRNELGQMQAQMHRLEAQLRDIANLLAQTSERGGEGQPAAEPQQPPKGR